MIVIFLLVLILFLIIILFAFPQFSPIPYFPSNEKDLPLIIGTLDLKNNQSIIDLGAGDGAVIFAAADEALKLSLNTEFVAVDINPALILIMYIKWLFHPNRKNIKIIKDNMFAMKFNPLTREPVNSLTIYLYISPWYLEKTILNIKNQISKFTVVSYMYCIKSLNKTEKIIKGNRHDIFRYNVS